jgi:hypothetical protein
MLRSPGFRFIDRPRRQENRAPAVGLDGDDVEPGALRRFVA